VNALLILSTLGLLGLFSEIFNFKKWLLPCVYTGLIISLATLVSDWNTNQPYFNDMIRMDNYAIAFSGLMIFISLLWFVLSPSFINNPENRVDQFTLILFSLLGGVVMTSFSNMIMLFLGLEILSISMYILAGSNKRSLASNEAALKYFLMGSFATCFLLFGIALVYGQTSSFNITAISESITNKTGEPVILYAGILMILFAMAFKVSAAPFHFWVPDVYQGSPTIITAYMSTVVKTAAFAAFLRLFMYSFSGIESFWTTTLCVLSAATILIGNITAVYQSNFKRMLAYSSISHAGYMILAILAMNNLSANSLLYYAAAYSVSSISSFAILLLISKSTGAESIESFNGLARRNPILAAATIIAMLSLAGIPPTAGFFAKYYIFSAAVQNNLTGLVLIAVAGSLIGVFYYFRVITALFKNTESVKIEMDRGVNGLILTTAIITLVLGILPGLITGLL
jgi:NADH-quinone oxidoreductase subunit N